MLSSVSKMFTAISIAKLVDRRQLSFDSTLGSLLPEYPSAEARESALLGHWSVRITERHYKPWVRTLQKKLEDEVRKAWS
jgi:CubicO group peptidase (beta-lactamase class C family)